MLGSLLEFAMDPFEATGQAWIGLLGGLLILGPLIAYLYLRKVPLEEDPDERFRRIERRASRITHGVLTIGLGLLALAVSLPWLRSSVWPAIWALLLAGIVVHEGSIEYYRRQM